jgi:hypothetical protein
MACFPSCDAGHGAGHHSDQCSVLAFIAPHRAISWRWWWLPRPTRAARLSNVAGGAGRALRWRASLDGEPRVKSR